MRLFQVAVVLISLNNVLGSKIFEEQVIVFDKYESCKSGLMMEIFNVTLRNDETRKTLINATLRLTRDFDSKEEQVIHLIRCKSKDSPDSCESFTTMRITNDCSMYLAKHQMWSTVVGRLQPPIRCPMKKGDYVLTDGFYDVNYIPFKAERNTYWKIIVKQFIIPTREEKMCIYAEAQLQRKKN